MPIRRLCDFADTCVFAKQSLGPILCDPPPLTRACRAQVLGVPLLPKLRGHFAEFLLHRSLEHLRLLASPTCVRLRYGHMMHSPPRLFSAAWLGRLTGVAPCLASGLGYPGLLSPGTAYPLAPTQPPAGPAFTPASPLRVVTHTMWFRNVHLIPIAYALRPRLRVRLTQGGRACPWKP